MLNQSGLITISPANVAAINNRLANSGYPGPPIATGLYSSPVHNTNFLSKIDHQIGPRDQFSVRYSLYRVDSQNSRGAGGLSAVSASAGLENMDQTLAVGNVATLSSRLVNETRGQFTNGNLKAPPTDPIGPAVNIAGVASFGMLSSSPVARLNRLYELADNVSYQAGSHAIRTGADFLFNDTTIAYPRSIRGSYSFSSLPNFLQGVYNNSGFTQTFGRSTVAQTNPNVGLYAQDEWRAAPRLTLNFGIRYDLQFLQTIHTGTDNIAPRAGFAWSPFSSRRMVVRGGFGLFYDRVPLRALANALLSANNTANPANLQQRSVSLSPAQSGAPVFPNILGGLTITPGILFSFSTMNRNMRNAYSEQGSFEIERQVGRNSAFSVGYQHLRGLHLIASINRNAPTCLASGNNNGCRPNPDYGNNSQYSAVGDSQYDGLHVSFTQRPARWGSYRISYTYSKALDDVGEFFFSSPINNFNLWQDYGRSDDDQRHRFAFAGVLHSPVEKSSTIWGRIGHGFQLSGIVQYYSALPFNITTGATTIQGTTARPMVNGVYIDRNSGSGFDFFNVGTRLSRTFPIGERFHMQAMAEAFNLLNHVNGVALNGSFGTGAYPANPSPSFQQITAVGDPRTLQFALRIAF
jgi:hypothetical protein